MEFKLKRDFLRDNTPQYKIGDGGILAQYSIIRGEETEVFKIINNNSEEIAKVANLENYYLVLLYNKPAMKVKKIDGKISVDSFYGFPHEIKGDLNRYGYTVFKNGLKAAQIYKENMEDQLHFWIDVNDKENQVLYIALVYILDYLK